MCWSGEVSTVFASLGVASTAYAVWRKEPGTLCTVLGYFSLMEALQASTYTVINQCENPLNQMLTLLGYLHIVFQPFFINALSLYFVPAAVRQRLALPVYILCFISSISMLVQLYPFVWAGPCVVGRSLCGEHLCAVSGEWHIAWDIPLNGLGNMFYHLGLWPFRSGFIGYVITGFLLPLLYGSWRLTLYHFLLGPTLAKLLTTNVNEQPAVWCLLSIGFLLIVLTPIRRFLCITSWPLWPKSWRLAAVG